MSSSADQIVAVDPIDAVRPPGPVAVTLWVSGLRCITTYVVLPALAPALGAFVVLAVPLVLALYGLSIATATFAAQRSARERRWHVCGVSVALLMLNVLSLVTVVGPRMVSG